MEYEKICMNCLHWGETLIEVSYFCDIDKRMRKADAAPCKIGQHIVDIVGRAYVLMGDNGSCEDGFEPHPEYLAELQDAKDWEETKKSLNNKGV